MTLKNQLSAKFAVAIVAVAMAFTAIAPANAAENYEEMSLEQLLALVAKLQGSTTAASNAAVCPYTWTRTLNMGATGADVMVLQKFLNSMPETQVAPVGQAGSAGMETSYYGPATGAAVANFQQKYRAEILSPLGLVNATTYFGPSTMAQANKLCVVGTTTGGDTDTDTDTDTPSGTKLQGEATLDNFDVDTGNDDEVEEGDMGEVAEIKVEFQDGDAEITRLDFKVDNGDVDPWDVFEEFTLWVDGKEVAKVNASDEDDYLNEDDGTFRFTNLKLVAEEDKEMEIVVGAEAQGNVDTEDQVGTWKLTPESIRYFDADGVATTEDGSILEGDATFEVVEAGYEEELTFRESDDNPEETTIVVDQDTSRTNNVEIFVYEIEAEGGDIKIEDLFVTLTVDGARATTTGNPATTTNLALVVDDLSIEIDGKTFDAEGSINSTTTQQFRFDVDKDVTIDEDETVEVKVMVDLKGTDDGKNYKTGTTIMAAALTDDVEATKAEGADDIESNNLNGAAEGEMHKLAAEGLISTISDITSNTTNDGKNVTFKFKMDVTAIEGDFYISRTPSTSVMASLDTASGATSSVSITSNATEVGNTYRITEGQTKTVTVSVQAANATSDGFVKAILNELKYGTTKDAPTGESVILGIPEFESDDETIVKS